MGNNQSSNSRRPAGSNGSARNRKRLAERKKALRARRIRRTVLVVMEAIMVCVLAVGCYGVSLFNTMQRGSLNKNELYIATFDNNQKETTAEAVHTSEEVSVELTTVEDIRESQKETVTEAQTQAETIDDILNHQEIVNGYWNILIVGVDARSQSELTSGVQSDVMIICSINASTKEVKLASIYRDTLLKMYSEDKYDKANAQLAKGDVTYLLSMINMNLDLQIRDVVVVNWLAVASVINELGGIYLDITPEEIDVNSRPYPNILNGYITEIVEYTGIGSTQITTPGLQKCDGVQAVAYCRNRYTVNNDYGRTERQREVIDKILEQAKVAGLSSLISALRYGLSNIYTSLDNQELMSLAMDVGSYSIGETSGFPYSSRAVDYAMGVQDPVVPENLAENVKQLHQFLFGDDGYQPSEMVQNISFKIIQETGIQ